jgi:hypothetical protein
MLAETQVFYYGKIQYFIPIITHGEGVGFSRYVSLIFSQQDFTLAP